MAASYTQIIQRVFDSATNRLRIRKVGPSDASVTSVADTTTETQLIAANSDRLELEITNTSSAVLYVLKGSGTAAADNLTVRLAQNETYSTEFTGAVRGVWETDPGDGNALITEST